MVDRTITLIRDDGKEIIADILFTYYSEEFKNNYVVFQVRDTGDVSAAIYTEDDDKKGVLDKVETEEEWQLLEELLNEYASENLKGQECGGCQGGCSGCSGCQGGCGEDCDCEGCGEGEE